MWIIKEARISKYTAKHPVVETKKREEMEEDITLWERFQRSQFKG